MSRPTVIFADEPTGNLDSRTSGEILELMRRSVEEYGQTTVMVTHDASAAAMADRVLFLADGEIVKETGRTSQHEILQIIDTLDLAVIRFALRGLLGRKLRTALTAIGVVLGVALVSGTYVLTDSITSAFDSIFSENYKNTDAAITGKPPFELGKEDGAGAGAAFDESLLAKVQELPEVEAADGNV